MLFRSEPRVLEPGLVKATSSPPSLSRRAGGPVCLPRSVCCLLPEVTGQWNRKSCPLPKRGKRKNPRGRLQTRGDAGQSGWTTGGVRPGGPGGVCGAPRADSCRTARRPPDPVPTSPPRSPAFADPGGGRRPGPELAERCPALVLWGQGLSAAPGACAAPGTQEDLKSASKKGILGATGRIPGKIGRAHV